MIRSITLMCSESCLMKTGSDTLLSSCLNREVGVLSECWKQIIWLLFSGVPSIVKVILHFQNLRVASFSEHPDTDIFSVLHPNVFSLICSLTTSFASSVFTFLTLDPKIYSPFLCLSQKELFLITHFPLLQSLS